LETSSTPLPVRLFNFAGALLRRLTPRRFDLSERALLGAACLDTGLRDFGGDGFREGLRELLVALEQDAHLSPLGRVRARNECVRLLRNRLLVQADLDACPDIAAQRIETPLFIVGFPRTGTTLLHNLLAQDAGHRTLLIWETTHPSPPPRADERQSDPRRIAVERSLRRFYAQAPEFAAIHPMHADGPEECAVLLQHTFASMQFETAFRVPGYSDWLAQQDASSAYAYFATLLRLLQLHCRAERWVLKSPVHLFTLGALFERFPDASVVHTHRDPLDVLPSQCSLVATLRALSSDHVDAHEIGREVPLLWSRGVERAMAFRTSVGDAGFVDLHYADLVEDPIGAVRGLYQGLGRTLTPESESRMCAWLDAHPQGRDGSHHYSLDQFGIDPARERERFAAYCARFGIAAGSAG